MPSFDDRSRSSFAPMPGLNQFVPSTEPLPPGNNLASSPPALPDDAAYAGRSSTALVPMSPSQWSPVLSDDTADSVGVTRVLSGTLIGDRRTTSMRTPVVIRATSKRNVSAPISHATHTKRRLFVSIIGMCLLLFITTSTLLFATPLGHDMGLNIVPFTANLFGNPNNASYNLTAQATATAVFHKNTDGYVPPSAGVVQSNGSLSWPVGQCTYWANMRYHQLTNFWVSWLGNADQWVAGARAAGWGVSQSPHVPSIIVLMPGVQNASSFGHVAVVEKINSDGSVYTSNMNWFDNGGGWDKESFVTFKPGNGVYFVYHL